MSLPEREGSMARIPCAQPRNLSIVIDGKKIRATLCGDPRIHEN